MSLQTPSFQKRYRHFSFVEKGLLSKAFSLLLVHLVLPDYEQVKNCLLSFFSSARGWLSTLQGILQMLLKWVELNEIITMIWQQWELQGCYSLCTEDKRHRELSDCVYLEVFAEQELGPCPLRQDVLPSWAHGTAPIDASFCCGSFVHLVEFCDLIIFQTLNIPSPCPLPFIWQWNLGETSQSVKAKISRQWSLSL